MNNQNTENKVTTCEEEMSDCKCFRLSNKIHKTSFITLLILMVVAVVITIVYLNKDKFNAKTIRGIHIIVYTIVNLILIYSVVFYINHNKQFASCFTLLENCYAKDTVTKFDKLSLLFSVIPIVCIVMIIIFGIINMYDVKSLSRGE